MRRLHGPVVLKSYLFLNEKSPFVSSAFHLACIFRQLNKTAKLQHQNSITSIFVRYHFESETSARVAIPFRWKGAVRKTLGRKLNFLIELHVLNGNAVSLTVN
jgi:hypothetical protein